MLSSFQRLCKKYMVFIKYLCEYAHQNINKNSRNTIMSAEFSHFLITRFNLNMVGWLPDKDKARKWMEERIQIFMQFTYPSICAQTCKNFKWLILFDPETKDNPAYAAFLKTISDQEFIEPVYIDTNETSYIKAIKDEIAKHTKPNIKHIITTRIDNDDAVSENFIERIQDEFLPNKNFVLNFTDGIGYAEDMISVSIRNKVNAFATYFEAMEDRELRTVYCRGHPALRKEAPVTHIGGELMYLIYFHGNNVGNVHKITTRIGLLWHYYVHFVCQTIPFFNYYMRYSFARPRPKDEVNLERFNLKL